MTTEMLQQIFELVLIPLLSVLVGFLVKYIQAKSNEIAAKVDNDLAKKYIKMFTDTVTTCVIATKQTYVESLKGQDAFTEEAQKKAFEMTKTAVLAVLSEEARKYLESMVGDFNAYLDQTIETTVNETK